MNFKSLSSISSSIVKEEANQIPQQEYATFNAHTHIAQVNKDTNFQSIASSRKSGGSKSKGSKSKTRKKSGSKGRKTDTTRSKSGVFGAQILRMPKDDKPVKSTNRTNSKSSQNQSAQKPTTSILKHNTKAKKENKNISNQIQNLIKEMQEKSPDTSFAYEDKELVLKLRRLKERSDIVSNRCMPKKDLEEELVPTKETSKSRLDTQKKQSFTSVTLSGRNKKDSILSNNSKSRKPSVQQTNRFQSSSKYHQSTNTQVTKSYRFGSTDPYVVSNDNDDYENQNEEQMIFSFTVDQNNQNQIANEITKKTTESDDLEAENFSLGEEEDETPQEDENETIDFYQPTPEQDSKVEVPNKFDSIASNISAQSRQSRIRMNKMKNIKNEISSLINKMDQSQRERNAEKEKEEAVQEEVYNEPPEKEQVVAVQSQSIPIYKDIVAPSNPVNIQQNNYDAQTTNRSGGTKEETTGRAMYEVMKKLTENQYNVKSEQNILSEPQLITNRTDTNPVVDSNPISEEYDMPKDEQNFAPDLEPQQPPGVPLHVYQELQSLAQALSKQNENLQKIAIQQDELIKTKDKEIFDMNEFICSSKEKFQKKVGTVESELQKKLDTVMARLLVLENGHEFEDVLKTYNSQMVALEERNTALHAEIKRMTLPEAKSENKLEEYNNKKLQTSYKKLLSEMTSVQKELTELRKKERIFTLHKRCAEDTTKKLSSHGKKISALQQEINDKNMTILNFQKTTSEMDFKIRELTQKNNQYQTQQQGQLEEIKLLKDFVYGTDPKAKEVHAFKFQGIGNTSASNLDFIQSSFDSRTNFNLDGSIETRQNLTKASSVAVLSNQGHQSGSAVTVPSLSQKIEDAFIKLEKKSHKSGMSFRDTGNAQDPKILISNLKAEVQLTEQQLQRSKETENKLIDLVHQIYNKLEQNLNIFDPEVKKINKCLREILSNK